MGHGVPDNTLQVEKLEQASLNTTKNVYSEINETDLIVHIGDLSYAVGYSAQVKFFNLFNMHEATGHYFGMSVNLNLAQHT